MKRIKRNPEKFDVIDLFDSIGQSINLKFNDPNSKETFLNSISLSLNKSITPIMLFGRRAESMFGYVAASLGKCKLIKKEDCGEVFFNDDAIKIPDYRIITTTEKQYLIEVKNFYGKDSFTKFKLKASYLDELLRYSLLVNVDLQIAIYWSKWNVWTMVAPFDFHNEGDEMTISLADAMKRNQMSILGDITIATLPNIAMRVYADPHMPRHVDKERHIDFTISNIELSCAGQVLSEEIEQHIAFMLIMLGVWEISGPTAKICDENLEYIEFVSAPKDRTTGQAFEIIGQLSGMISSQYKWITAPDGKVARLSPDIETGMLGFQIPEDYKSKSLPLWRFEIQPNYD